MFSHLDQTLDQGVKILYQSIKKVWQFTSLTASVKINNVLKTSRQFGKRIKEHIQKSSYEFCKTSFKEYKSIGVVNASKISAIAENT